MMNYLYENNKNIYVVANMATFPERMELLEKVVNSILNQVDILNIYLNNYDYIPEFLKNKKINVVLSNDALGDIKDNGKFYFLDKVPEYCYYFTIDDDILYPSNYVNKLIEKLNFYNDKIAVGVHGIIFNTSFNSFKESRIKNFYFENELEKDTYVSILGTGTLAFKKNVFNELKLGDFKNKGVADLYFANFCKNNYIPMICISRDNDWLKNILPRESYSIWNEAQKDESLQNKIIEEYKLYEKFYTKDINFSIILPTYNRKHCIKNAIDSLLIQTYQNFELIIVDDGSTDDTEEYIKEIYKNEIEIGKIRYLKLDQNHGASFARNRGLEIAKNKWIGYLDTDNEMCPEFLETYVKYISENPEYKIFYAKIKHRNSGIIIGHEFDNNEIKFTNFIDMGVFIYNIDIYKNLGGFNEDIKKLVDWDLILKYTEKYYPFFIDKILLDYYDGDEFDRITNKENNEINYKRVILNYLNNIPDKDFIDRYQIYYQKFLNKNKEIENLNSNIEEQEKIINQKELEIKNKEEIINQKELDLKNKEEIIRQKELEINNKNQIIQQKNLQLNAVLNSTCWKMTKPIRVIKDKIKRFLALAKFSFFILKNEGVASLFKRTVKFFYKKIKNKYKNIYVFIKNKIIKTKTLIQKSFFVLKKEGFLILIRKIFVYIKKKNIIKSDENSSEKIAIAIFNKQQSEISINDTENQINNFKVKPLISIIMPVYNTPTKWLEIAIQSVVNQSYKNWELCIVDDCSTNGNTKRVLEKYKNDKRFKLHFSKENGGISKASNIALKMATGDYIGLLDHDDELTPDALFWVVKTLNEKSDIDFIYSDECKIDDSENRNLFHFFFKPDWSPEMMFNSMYTSHFTVYKKSLVEKVGMFRSEYDFSQDYDLALRCSEKADNICHIERILYLWRAIDGSAAKEGGKDFARESNIKALQDTLDRRGLKAKALALPYANYVHFLDKNLGKVSIIIPSDSYKNIRRSIDNIKKKTDYKNYEIIVVCTSGLKNILEKEYPKKNIIFNSYDKKFNFSDKCNQGANVASGEILVFYNDDVIPLNNDWLDKLIEYLFIPGVGGVSPKLLYENGKIQYAGMTTNSIPFCGTFLHEKNENETMANFIRNVSILSGACLAIKKKIFFDAGCFDSKNTPSGHSDLDLSFKLIESNYRCLYTPYSKLVHIGNHSWHTKNDKADIFILSRWGKYISNDPYYTKSMRAFYEGYFEDQFGIFSNKSKFVKYKFDVLVLIYELSITGAPIIALNAAKEIKKYGGFPVIYSYVDGPLRLEVEKCGIPLIINNFASQGHSSFELFAKNFDIILANTVVVYPSIHQIQDIVKTIWYIHEANNINGFFIPYFNNHSPSLKDVLYNCRAKIFVASEYSKNSLKYINSDIKILNYGINDQYRGRTNNTKNLVFSIVGTVEDRKGQDIFIKAIIKLPDNYRKKAIFNIIGNDSFYNDYVNNLKKETINYPEIKWLGLISDQNKKNEIFENTSVFVIPSRDEPTSLIAIEASMFSKPSIITKNVGAKYLVNENNGFILDTGDSEQLKNLMMKIIDNPEILIPIGKEARKKYLETSTMDIFSKNLLNIIKNLISK